VTSSTRSWRKEQTALRAGSLGRYVTLSIGSWEFLHIHRYAAGFATGTTTTTGTGATMGFTSTASSKDGGGSHVGFGLLVSGFSDGAVDGPCNHRAPYQD
jgi:hypothetical protein